jgi:acetoin utilization deacetylase AcuC-like enzyme
MGGEGFTAREPDFIGGRAGFYALDTSTPIVAGTYVAARAAVDVALTAVDAVLGGESAVYGLCRPPGHHAGRSMYGGYCFFNNAAIAAQAITERTGEQVAILDVDYHHGNGTQQIFWRRGDVLYVSLHGDPARAYPYYLGYADEVGEGEGRGTTLNLPLPAGCTNEPYLAALERGLDRIADEPGSIVVVSLGLDTYGMDPICDFALTTDVYHAVGTRVAALGRKLVILQEGGYHRPALGENVRAWLRGAEGRPFDPTPATGFSVAGTLG